MKSTFLPYEEPTTVQLLTLASFLVLLPTFQRVFQRLFFAGLLGPLVLGIIYGVPLMNILPRAWQVAFLALGYVGLILLVFEGGLHTRLDLLRANAPLSVICALTGIGCPIGLSFALLNAGFGYASAEAFVLGAALSATSLGTTFAILGVLSQTRVGTIIMSAAMIDDVVGLIMASVVTSLGSASSGGNSLRWSIGRPIIAAGLLTLLVPVFTKFIIRPAYYRFFQTFISRHMPYGHVVMMVLVIFALCSIAAYAGTSTLYGAYLAGAVLASLDVHTQQLTGHDRSLPTDLARVQVHDQDPVPERLTFALVFDKTFAPIQHNLFEPLFFASIGFAIPFRSAWSGVTVWRGFVYAILMAVGKLVVGAWIPIWTIMPETWRSLAALIYKLLCLPAPQRVPVRDENPVYNMSDSIHSAIILGSAMVARGEIGLLILQLGYIRSGHVSEQGFIVGTWAVVLNTLFGPIVVGVLMRHMKERILRGPWGVVAQERKTQL